jgi:hypothetical protein
MLASAGGMGGLNSAAPGSVSFSASLLLDSYLRYWGR